MPFNGSGVFTPSGADFPAQPGTLILSTKYNNVINDVATGLTTCLTKDGQTTPTADLPMGGFKHVNVADGNSRASPAANYASLGQVQDSGMYWGGTAGGTADALTISLSPAIPAYAAGQVFRFKSGASPNTGAATLAVSGLATKALQIDGAALTAGLLQADRWYQVLYDGTAFQLQAVGTVNAFTGAVTFTGVVVFNNTMTAIDGNFSILGSSDATKRLGFEVDGYTTATRRVVTFPDISFELTRMLSGYITGLSYTNDATDAANDIDVLGGNCMNHLSTYWIPDLPTNPFIKRSDANWAQGLNQGALDTGAVGNNDYFIWMIGHPATGVSDILFSLSSTSPTMPSGWTARRLIGYFKRVGGSIVPFTTYETEGGGLEYLWTTPTLDIDLAATLTTSRRTDAVKVPLTFSVTANLNVTIIDAAASALVYIYCPDAADLAPVNNAAPLASCPQSVAASSSFNNIQVRTDATGKIAARASIATVDNYRVSTLGFRWARRLT